ncbi:MAG: hypothetical protein HN348_22160 [Proteobacteria bacterium]|nr:hypothetical protein [Pseudomonadota bacterium]
MSFIAVAIALYPGGTWFDYHAVGHSFWLNFLCDLMQTEALNGEAAPVGSLFARLGTLAMFTSLAAFFVQIARLESPVSRHSRLTPGHVAAGAGVVACMFGFAIPLVPSDLFRNAHLVVVVCAFVPSLVAVIASLVVCLRGPTVSWWIKGLALLTLATGALDGVLYGVGYAQAYQLIPHFQRWLLNHSLPVLQRLATLALLGWVIAVNVDAVRTCRARNRL